MNNVKEMSFTELNELCKSKNEEAWNEINSRIKLAQNGDEQMMTDIINSNKDLAYKMAHHYEKAVTISTFDDLVSFGVLGIIKAVKTYDPSKRCLFSKHLYFQMKGEITSAIRNELKNNSIQCLRLTSTDFDDNEQRSHHFIAESTISDESDDPFEVLNTRMNLQLVNKALKTISPKQRQAFVMQHVYGMKQEEAAKRLGVSYATFNTRSRNARMSIARYCKNKVQL